MPITRVSHLAVIASDQGERGNLLWDCLVANAPRNDIEWVQPRNLYYNTSVIQKKAKMTERKGAQTPESTPEQNRAAYLAVVGSSRENSLFLGATVSAAVSGYDAYATVAIFNDCCPKTLADLSDPACCYDMIISADPRVHAGYYQRLQGPMLRDTDYYY